MLEARPSKRNFLRNFVNTPKVAELNNVFDKGPGKADLGAMGIISSLRELEIRHGMDSVEFFDDYREGRYDSKAFKIPNNDMVTWVGLSYVAITSSVMRMPLPARLRKIS